MLVFPISHNKDEDIADKRVVDDQDYFDFDSKLPFVNRALDRETVGVRRRTSG